MCNAALITWNCKAGFAFFHRGRGSARQRPSIDPKEGARHSREAGLFKSPRQAAAHFTVADGTPILTIAGLWDDWKNKATDEPIKSCSMIISAPNDFVAEVHDRMPLIKLDQFGSIERVMIDKVSGQVSYAVLSFGGFLGMGHHVHPVAVPQIRHRTGITHLNWKGRPSTATKTPGIEKTEPARGR